MSPENRAVGPVDSKQGQQFVCIGDVKELRMRAESAAGLGRCPFAPGTVQSPGVFLKPALGGVTSPASALFPFFFLPHHIIATSTHAPVMGAPHLGDGNKTRSLHLGLRP